MTNIIQWRGKLSRRKPQRENEEEEEEEISRGMADRSHAMYTVSRRNIHNLDAKRNKARETREFQILFQFQHFSSIAESEACRSIPPDSEMLAETHEINHRRRHWAPFQNRNVTTERPPPSPPRPMTNLERAGLPVFFSLFLFRHDSNCIVRLCLLKR